MAAQISTVLGHNVALIRGALAHLLRREDDIEVVSELARADQVIPELLARRPDVAVLDLDLFGLADLSTTCALPCRMLILAERRRSCVISQLAAGAERVGFVATDGPADRLVDAVRRVARGELFLDPELVVAALRTHSPLTRREVEVLAWAAPGLPLKEIAVKLSLSQGTVRNYMSRILTKTGARTRIEAVRIATDSGWI